MMHPADAAGLDLLGPQLVAVEHHRLALEGHPPELAVKKPPTVSQSPSGRSEPEEVVHLVDRHAGVLHAAARQRLDHGLLHVELVADLPHQAPSIRSSRVTMPGPRTRR